MIDTKAGLPEMFTLDTSTPFGQRASQRLETEEIGWLTTVSASNQPLPSPIWFVWDGQTVLIYSQPNQPKVRNILHNSQVSFSLNSDEHGNDVIILQGRAVIDPAAPTITNNLVYLNKYREGFLRIGMTIETASEEYSAAIRVVPDQIRGQL